MTQYAAYYDASGSVSTDGSLVVVGLVASEAKWLKFESRWRGVLDQHQLAHFHMKDCAQLVGSFAGWSEERRRPLLEQLVQTIKGGVNKTIIRAVSTADFAELRKQKSSLLTGLGENAYALGSTLCMRAVDDWVQGTKHPERPTRHVIEHGDSGQGIFRAMMQDYPNIPLSILPKVDCGGKRVRQFEAADMIAYELRLAYNRLERGRQTTRKLGVQIARHLPIDLGWIEKGSLLELHSRTQGDEVA